MCEYKFRNGSKCKEEAFENSKYCILHIELPEDEESEEFKRINELKEEKVEEKVNNKLNFCVLYSSLNFEFKISLYQHFNHLHWIFFIQ